MKKSILKVATLNKNYESLHFKANDASIQTRIRYINTYFFKKVLTSWLNSWCKLSFIIVINFFSWTLLDTSTYLLFINNFYLKIYNTSNKKEKWSC